MGMIRIVALALFAFGSLVPVDADAQSRSGRRRAVRLAAEELEGTVQKPELQIFMGRQNLSANEQLELRESFLPRIIESVESKPF